MMTFSSGLVDEAEQMGTEWSPLVPEAVQPSGYAAGE